MLSLLEYAVKHRDGGMYYPNAVMPYRGLLESEAYAHSMLCDLMRDCSERMPLMRTEYDKVADGVRLWLMLQKETQQWSSDPAFIEAISSVLDGSQEVLSTKVLILEQSGEMGFQEVKASGNGFTIQREYYLERTVDGKTEYVRIADGDEIHVGDRIRAEYRIWNQENRSFVKMTAPRPAALRPVQQLSGHIGWWLRPLSIDGWSLSPQGYREVRSDRSEYWFDSYPEENTTITEEFFVTQAGTFQTPVIEIESLYAQHYRANGDGSEPMMIRK